jgi:hypothetical protein
MKSCVSDECQAREVQIKSNLLFCEDEFCLKT